MSGIYGFSREAVRVKVKKCEGNLPPEWRKFSVDPQITSLEVLYSILAKAFDLRTDFGISYRAIDPTNGQEVYLPVLSDYDLDASFLRAHNLSITTSSEPCLNLRVDIKPFSEAPEWESGSSNVSRETSPLQQSLTSGQRYVQTVQNRLPGLIINQMEKTFSMVQRALNLVEDPSISQPPRQPLSDSEFRGFLDSVGQIVHAKELRKVIYIGGIDPSLRRVVWKHILNVYPDGMTGRERMDYMKRKAAEYYVLRDKWKTAVQKGSVVGELAYVTSMVRKDVLRTDRLHPFYAGSDDNQNIASLFNILTTYALNHPAVSYCQGMSDIASPLLVTMNDEAHAYICFCAVMIRLRPNFMLDGIAMTTKFSHLSESLQYYDPEFYEYLKLQQADDLLFCYRWLLLEMKREFAFEDSLRMLEVLWSSLPSTPPIKELPLFEREFDPPAVTEIPIPKSPSSVIMRQPRENPYTKICALRRQSSALSLHSSSLTSTPSPCNFGNQPHEVLANQTNHNHMRGIRNSSPSPNRLDSTKRLNQSLDENITRTNRGVAHTAIVKSHQSLDESKMLHHLNSKAFDEAVKAIVNDLNADDNHQQTIDGNPKERVHVRPRSVSPAKNDDRTIEKESTSNAVDEQEVEDLDNEKVIDENHGNELGTVGSLGRKGSGHHYHHHHHHNHHHNHHRGLNQINNKSMFNSTGNLITKQLNSKKSGHFKDLKDRIASGKKGIFASLDKIESMTHQTGIESVVSLQVTDGCDPQSQNLHQTQQSRKSQIQSKGQKVVKNFNEFLNFASINKSRISDRLATTTLTTTNSHLKSGDEKSKPLIKLTKSSFDDSDSLTASETVTPEIRKPPLQLQLNILETSMVGDGSSPDDSQEYFPMTTSMTRELRLELENLDRQVFGTDFRNQFSGLSGGETPESGDSVDKIPYSEFNYKKLNQQSLDGGVECDSDGGGGGGVIKKTMDKEIEPCPLTINMRNRTRSAQHHYDEKRISTCSANNDVFIWENPLHHFGPNSPQQTIAVDIETHEPPSAAQTALPPVDNILMTVTDSVYGGSDVEKHIPTPDEQLDLDYDGEIIEENNLGKKSVTPIRLVRKHDDCSNSNRNSMALNDTIDDSDNSESWNENRELNTIQSIAGGDLSVLQPIGQQQPSGPINMTNSCEEASEIQPSVMLPLEMTKLSGILPKPQDFGCGNPFLMFLSLTLLLQHRDYVMKSGMDYNEMAMHFDKMVRKHNVTRVLNQARRMYSEYLKSQSLRSARTSDSGMVGVTAMGLGSGGANNLGNVTGVTGPSGGSVVGDTSGLETGRNSDVNT